MQLEDGQREEDFLDSINTFPVPCPRTEHCLVGARRPFPGLSARPTLPQPRRELPLCGIDKGAAAPPSGMVKTPAATSCNKLASQDNN